MEDQLQNLMQMRSQALEQFAHVSSELEMLKARRPALKQRAALLMEDIRQLTAQVNQLQQQPPKVAPDQQNPEG